MKSDNLLTPHFFERWYFPFTRSYWCPKTVVGIDEPTPTIGDSNVPIEDISESTKKVKSQDSSSVYIHGLSKQFGEKTAVDNLNMSMYSGQITCLLGHNGAGKTTTIGMLTGMVPPTSGYATVAGYDIRTDMATLRENVGVCLQHDCLFPQLTVEEHIIFFSKVKGLYTKKTKEECKQSVTTIIKDVALQEKQRCFAKDLSGGMKRKLSGKEKRNEVVVYTFEFYNFTNRMLACYPFFYLYSSGDCILW